MNTCQRLLDAALEQHRRANRSRRRLLARRAKERSQVWLDRSARTTDATSRTALTRARKLFALAMRLRGSP